MPLTKVRGSGIGDSTTALDVKSLGVDFTSDTYQIVKIQTDNNDDGSNDDAILQFTNGSSKTVKGEIRFDESESMLEIGAGDNQGHIKIDANGHVRMPSQSAFLARKSSDTQNLNYDTYHTVIFDTETFDQNGDYNNSTGIFTAPVTGRYQLNVLVYLQEIPSNAGYLYVQLACSNNAAFNIMDTAPLDDATPYKTMPLSILMDMDANDTAKVFVYIQGGSTTTDIDGGTENNTSFSGFLVA